MTFLAAYNLSLESIELKGFESRWPMGKSYAFRIEAWRLTNKFDSTKMSAQDRVTKCKERSTAELQPFIDSCLGEIRMTNLSAYERELLQKYKDDQKGIGIKVDQSKLALLFVELGALSSSNLSHM